MSTPSSPIASSGISLAAVSLQGLVRAVAILGLAWTVPLRLAGHGWDAYSVWDLCISLLLGWDVIWRFWHHKGLSLVAVSEFVAAIPLELIGLALNASLPLLAILILFRLQCVIIWFFYGTAREKLAEHFLLPSPIERAIVSALAIVVLAHWVACGWLLLANNPVGGVAVADYIDALYWTVVTMASVGYGDITPHTIVQKLYAIAVIFLGVGIYGYIIGNVAALLSSLDKAKEKHRERMAEMVSWLRFRGVPMELRRRVGEHMRLLWEKRLALDDAQMLRQLPPSLRAELATHLHSELLKRVPLFSDAPMAFLSELATCLRHLVLQPGECVCEKGQKGDEMYFIGSGQVQVLEPNGNGIVATLGAGAFFGEIALLLQEPRTATVQTLSLCELYSLSHNDFYSTLALFPAFARQVHAEAQRRKNELG